MCVSSQKEIEHLAIVQVHFELPDDESRSIASESQLACPHGNEAKHNVTQPKLAFVP